jgi:hypothetical protein
MTSNISLLKTPDLSGCSCPLENQILLFVEVSTGE